MRFLWSQKKFHEDTNFFLIEKMLTIFFEEITKNKPPRAAYLPERQKKCPENAAKMR